MGHRPLVLIHPAVGEELGVEDGALVRLGNTRGTVLLHARLFTGVQRDVVVVESIWPNRNFVEGIGINALVGADRAPPGGGAVFHDTAVWLKSEPATGSHSTPEKASQSAV